MTILDLTYMMAPSFGLSCVLTIAISTAARPIFLRSPMYIGDHKLSVLLDLGQSLLFTLVGPIKATARATHRIQKFAGSTTGW